ncbi:MAG TPA: phage holin family protein [Nordella sp.]|nr:phage holin family protein [Nordella sp.]
MANSDGKPVDETLAGSFDELKSDFTAWFMAESALLRARMSSSARRVALAAAMIVIGLIAAFVALTVLANALVQYLSAAFGPITAGLMVGFGLLLVVLLLILGARALLLGTDPLQGRLRGSAKFIWSAFRD